jgi:hypothetical protein
LRGPLTPLLPLLLEEFSFITNVYFFPFSLYIYLYIKSGMKANKA